MQRVLVEWGCLVKTRLVMRTSTHTPRDGTRPTSNVIALSELTAPARLTRNYHLNIANQCAHLLTWVRSLDHKCWLQGCGMQVVLDGDRSLWSIIILATIPNDCRASQLLNASPYITLSSIAPDYGQICDKEAVCATPPVYQLHT